MNLRHILCYLDECSVTELLCTCILYRHNTPVKQKKAKMRRGLTQSRARCRESNPAQMTPEMGEQSTGAMENVDHCLPSSIIIIMYIIEEVVQGI